MKILEQLNKQLVGRTLKHKVHNYTAKIIEVLESGVVKCESEYFDEFIFIPLDSWNWLLCD